MSVNRNVYLLWVFMLCLALYLSSCGTKKVIADKQNTYNKDESKKEVESETTSKEEATTQEEVKETKDDVNDITTTETVKKYNPDGTLNEERTTTTIDKSKKSSTSHRKLISYEIKTTTAKVRTVDYKLQIVKTMTKHRNVDKDSTWVKNVGGKGVLIVLALIVVAGVGIYFYLKK